MRHLLPYILLMSFLFALLDWKVIEVTRFQHPEWKEWMHSHETVYSNVIYSLEYVLCAPAMALKPIFYYAAVSTQASQEQQEAILHAPKPDWTGFYHLPVRGQSWTFVSWLDWFVYWLPQSIIWIYALRFLGAKLYAHT